MVLPRKLYYFRGLVIDMKKVCLQDYCGTGDGADRDVRTGRTGPRHFLPKSKVVLNTVLLLLREH